MAGPGLRAWHFALELKELADVVMIASWNGTARPAEVKSLEWGSPEAAQALEHADVIIGQPHRALLRTRKARHVFDLFDPVVLELDELYGARGRFRQRLHQRLEWARLERALDEADLLLAATPRQRDFYWGIQRSRRSVDHSWLDRWLVVPFGIERAPERVPPSDPPRIVWGGGLWGWLDPELAFEAVSRLRQTHAFRFVVAGGARPGGVEASPRVEELRRLARDLGDTVEWIDEWIPYASRWSLLSGASAALALHKRTVEAEFSIRIRLFDAVGAGVPIVATRGGFMADLAERHGLGVVVEPGDADGVAEGLRRLLDDAELQRTSREACAAIAPEFAWSRVVRPLRERIAGWIGR